MGILFPYHPMPLRFRCSSSGIGIWAYRAVFAATAAGYMGIPIIGTAAIGAAAVLSSPGQLIITAVLIVAVIGNGQQLYVSYNTIHSHVRSIYRKLGVSSRAQQRTASSGSRSRGAWLPACVPACSPGR